MCDDLTRQEILFFTVMQASSDGISEEEIFNRMADLAAELNWPSYLNSVPRPLSERLEEARERSMIFKYQPLRWRPEPVVAGYVRHLVSYLDNPEQREKICRMLEGELHAAE